MKLFTKTIIAAGALVFGPAVFVAAQESSADSKCEPTWTEAHNCDDGYTWGLTAKNGIMPWGLPTAIGVPTLWSLFDPYLLDIPGGGKGLPVHGAKDPSKIIGYLKMPAPAKPKGPVHCMVKETGLLAKTVDDCEAAGGTVAK